MTDFDPNWLQLREAADNDARNGDVLETVIETVGRRAHARIMDIGAGTGSTLRAIADLLPLWQSWTLVDNDVKLLAAAREHLAEWAGSSQDLGDDTSPIAPIKLSRGRHTLEVTFVRCDLSVEPLPVPEGGVHLVTSSAFFDLTSSEFVQRIVDDIVDRGLPLYAALEVDGRIEWTPPHPLDEEMIDAFVRDQSTDKGFGEAIGGDAPRCLADAFKADGYSVDMGPSDWRIGTHGRASRHAALCAVLAASWAEVARKTRLVSEPGIARWLEARESDASGCVIGHQDMLFRPL